MHTIDAHKFKNDATLIAWHQARNSKGNNHNKFNLLYELIVGRDRCDALVKPKHRFTDHMLRAIPQTQAKKEPWHKTNKQQ